MKKDFLTDEQVEREIERLWQSEEVRLAKKETNIKYKRRQYLYQLRLMEKRGAELIKQGYTFENIEQRMFGGEIEND
jgi:SOS response regulatory protein OraA/RecX